MNSTGEEISDDELDECAGTIEDTMNHIFPGRETEPRRIDLTKYNRWSVIGWTIIAALLLTDIVVSALF